MATDVVEFKNKTLTYYRGNYDTFEAVRSEKRKNQRRLYEANMAKRAHMQDFIDKFRKWGGEGRGCVCVCLCRASGVVHPSLSAADR